MVVVKRRSSREFEMQGPESRILKGGGILESSTCIRKVRASVPQIARISVKGSWWPAAYKEVEVERGYSLLLMRKRFPDGGNHEEIRASSTTSLLSSPGEVRQAMVEILLHHREMLELKLSRHDGKLPSEGYGIARIKQRAKTIAILRNLLDETINPVSHIIQVPKEFITIRGVHALLSFDRDGFEVGVFPCGSDEWGNAIDDYNYTFGNSRMSSYSLYDVTIHIDL